MNPLLRRSVSMVRQPSVQRRMMSSGPIDIEAEKRSMHSWKKISYFATIGVSAFFAVVFLKTHPHEERGNYPYNQWRVKAYPWGDGNTNLFQKEHH